MRIEERSEGKAVAISVADTGIGIPGADIERILEPFQQAESTVARRREGTGLDFSITKNLVAAAPEELRAAV